MYIYKLVLVVGGDDWAMAAVQITEISTDSELLLTKSDKSHQHHMGGGYSGPVARVAITGVRSEQPMLFRAGETVRCAFQIDKGRS